VSPVTECAFCAKRLRDVRKMVVSEVVGIGICDECIGLSIKLIAEDTERLRTDRKVLLGALKDCVSLLESLADGDHRTQVLVQADEAKEAIAQAEAP